MFILKLLFFLKRKFFYYQANSAPKIVDTYLLNALINRKDISTGDISIFILLQKQHLFFNKVYQI